MSTVNQQLLLKNWVHSHEEDTGNNMVFRPSTYKLPPARGRTSMDLKQDGSMVQGGFAPDDRKTLQSANWKLDNDTLILNHEQPGEQKLKIVSLANDKLVVER